MRFFFSHFLFLSSCSLKGKLTILSINSLIKAFFSHKPLFHCWRLDLGWVFPCIPFASVAFHSRESPSWLPASPGIVCAWVHLPGSWCCRRWSEHDQQSVGGEAMLKGGVLPAGGRLGAADIPAPAGPGGGGPAASAQPPCPRCKQSLTEQQGAHGKTVCRCLNFLSCCHRKKHYAAQ